MNESFCEMSDIQTQQPLDKLKITNLKEEAALIQQAEEDVKAREQRIYEKRVAQASHAREMRKRKREMENETMTKDKKQEQKEKKAKKEIDDESAKPEDKELHVPASEKIYPNPEAEDDKKMILQLHDELKQLKQSLQAKSEELAEVSKLRQELKHAIKPAQPASYWKSMPKYSSW
jgi:hypothetical protein